MNPKDHAQDQPVIHPQTVASNGSVTALIDWGNKSAGYATIRVNIASELNTNADPPVLTLAEADVTAATSFATLTATSSPDNTNPFQQVYHVDLRGRKRYGKLTVAAAGNDTNDELTISANATLYHMRVGPNSTTDMIATGEANTNATGSVTVI